MSLPRVFTGLRPRLIGLTLLAFGPACLLVLYNASGQQRADTAQAQLELERLADLSAANLNLLVDKTRQLLQVLAQLPQLQEDPAFCSAQLATLLAQHPAYANLGLIGADGLIRCSALAVSAPIDAGDRSFFQRASQDRAFRFGNYQIGRITGKPTLNTGYPVAQEDGGFNGVLFAAIDLSPLTALMPHTALPPGTTLTLVDEESTVLRRWPEAPQAVGHPLDEIRDRNYRLTVTRALAGSAPGAHVSLIVSVPKALVLASAHRTLKMNLWLLALTTLLVLAITGLYGETGILRPLHRLMAATRQLARGDLSARTGLQRAPGELGELARAFDEMAASLQMNLGRRREAEQALSESEQRYEDMIRDAPDPIITLDAVGRVTSMNPAGERASGYGAGDVLGKPFATLGILSPMAVAAALKEFAFVIAGRERAPVEYEIIRKDSTRGIYEGNARRLQRDRRTIGVQVILRDVTLRKQAEARLRQTLEQLRAAQNDLVQSEKLAGIGQAAAKIAHELKNPLGIISMAGQLLARKDRPLSPEHTDEVVASILDAVRRADQTIRGLLDFSRPHPLVLAAVDPHAVLEAALRAVTEQHPLEGIEVARRLMPSPPPLQLDASQLQQVFVNLIENAAQAMPQGGRLTLSTRHDKARAEWGRVGQRTTDAFREGESVFVYEVADTGEGIAPEHLAKVFDPFFSTKPKGQGTGLGLPIVRTIVEAHRGLIAVSSTPGAGTTFRIVLPI